MTICKWLSILKRGITTVSGHRDPIPVNLTVQLSHYRATCYIPVQSTKEFAPIKSGYHTWSKSFLPHSLFQDSIPPGLFRPIYAWTPASPSACSARFFKSLLYPS
jgi:hypothetical protein